MSIEKIFNASLLSAQVQKMYVFVWVQIILQGFYIIQSHTTESLYSKLNYKIAIATILMGAYIILTVRLRKIINVLRKQENLTGNILAGKFLSIIFIIIFTIIIAYL